MTIEQKFKRWLEEPRLTKKEKETLQSYSEAEIQDAFYCDLAFGTAGIRGVLGPGSNRMNRFIVRKCTVGFAKYVLKMYPGAKEQGVVIAHDNRLCSREFCLETAAVFASFGIKAYIFDALRPTPELSFAVRELKACGGVMITASHNPMEYNGYKVYDETGCQLIPERIALLVSLIEELGFELDVADGGCEEKGEIIPLDGTMDDAYCEAVKQISLLGNLDKTKIKIVFSPQHGTSYINGMRIFRELGYSVIPVEEQCSPDPLFSNTKSPNPENDEAYLLPLDYAKKHQADLILVTDPDADRVGIAFLNSKGSYELYTGNQTGALLIDYVLGRRKELGILSKNGVLFHTIVTSSLGAKIAESYGVTVETLLTGFKFIGNRIAYYEKTKEKTFEFGYEESYGYLIQPFVRDKDSLQALVMISEMVNYYLLQGKRLDQVMDELQSRHGYHKDSLYSIYFKGMTGSERMKTLMEQLRANPLEKVGSQKVIAYEDYQTLKRYENVQVSAIEHLPPADVIKLFLEDGTTIAVRPSGTEPKCKFYYGAVSKNQQEAENKPALYHQAICAALNINE